MADCSDLEAKLRAAEERLAAAKKIRRAVEGEEAVAAEGDASPTFRTFSMVDGTKIRVNAREFYRQVEKDNLAMGEDELRKLVQDRFDNDVKPNGSKGLNINYAQMDLNEENVNALLTLAGQRRMESKEGKDLAMPFTQEVATNALVQEFGLRGGAVEEIARDMARAGSGITSLPKQMAIIKTMKLDSARHYADMLEDSADLIDSFGLSPQKKAELSRASQYMHFFEQLDAKFARKVGQALRVRNFDIEVGVTDGLKYQDVERLDLDTMKPGSLAVQVLEAVETGNAEDLRKLATAKRVGVLNDVGINDGNVMTQVKMLNTLRKDNLFLSPNTWMQRNVVAGALVNFSNGVEDFYAQAFKTKDLSKAFHTATFAYGRMAGGFYAAWGNAMESLTTGKATFTSAGIKEGLDPQSLALRKENTQEMLKVAAQGLNTAWDDVFNKQDLGGGIAAPVAGMNLLNLGARYVLGKAVEKLTGSTAGFMPAFSLLSGGDEITRKMAFDWKVGFDAYAIALREWDELAQKPANMSKAEWVAGRANERADQAVFSGLMTDDELVAMRRGMGAMQYGDMSNEALRLKMFNDQNGLPNPGTPEGLAGAQRAAEATFTQKIDDPLGQGVQMARQNPVVGWIVPVFQTPYNGLKWLLQRDIFIALPTQIMREVRQAKGDVSNKPFTPDEMAEARAKTLNAAFISAATYGLWQTGLFSDGGSFNSDQNKRERGNVPPYSFSIGLSGLKLGMSRLNFSGASIDLVDLMGLQADIHRAHHEGLISDKDLGNFMTGVLQGYSRVLDNKQSLSGVMELLNGLSRMRQGQDVNWAGVMAKQMNGTLPLSGFVTAASRGFQDPNVVQTGRRQLSSTEIKALENDPSWNVFQEFGAKIVRNYPVLGTFGYQVRQRDWLGRERRRPFGMPLDVAAPFAPIITSDTPFDQWMNKHGLGSVPRPGGKVGGSDLGMTGAASTQMSIEEENTYRNAMGTIKGQMPAEVILGKNAYIQTGIGNYSIDSYVQGRTMLEALTALSLDAQYNRDLDAPNSPSIAGTELPYAEQSLGNRKKSINDPRGVYKVWNAIVTYYDKQAIGVMAQQHPDFVTKALANSAEKTKRIIEDLEASPLGLSRQ